MGEPWMWVEPSVGEPWRTAATRAAASGKAAGGFGSVPLIRLRRAQDC